MIRFSVVGLPDEHGATNVFGVVDDTGNTIAVFKTFTDAVLWIDSGGAFEWGKYRKEVIRDGLERNSNTSRSGVRGLTQEG